MSIGALLGPSWSIVGPFRCHLGHFWAHFGGFWALWVPCGALLGSFWALLGPLGPIVRSFWALLGPINGNLAAQVGYLGQSYTKQVSHSVWAIILPHSGIAVIDSLIGTHTLIFCALRFAWALVQQLVHNILHYWFVWLCGGGWTSFTYVLRAYYCGVGNGACAVAI